MGLLTIAAIAGLFLLVNNVTGGNLYRHIVNITVLMPAILFAKLVSLFPGSDPVVFMDTYSRVSIGPESAGKVYDIMNQWVTYSLMLAVPLSIISSMINPVSYTIFRSKAKPINEHFSEQDALRISSRVNAFCAENDMSNVPVFITITSSVKPSLNVMGIGSKDETGLFITQGYANLLLSLDDKEFAVFSKIMLHELLHIKSGTTQALFAMQLSSVILLGSMTIIFLFFMRSKQDGGNVKGRLSASMGEYAIRTGAFLILSAVPLYIAFRVLIEYLDNKVWSNPAFDDEFMAQVGRIIEDNNITVSQGNGLPFEFHLLGCEGDMLKNN